MANNDVRKVYCRFRYEDRESYGLVDDGHVVELDGAPFGRHRVTSAIYALSDVTLLVPTTPRTFFCAGRNYAGHAGLGQLPQAPEIGYRSNTALIAHDEDIVKPKNAGQKFHYEGELVAVIGKAGKHIARAAAMDHVFGWTIGNDVTERTWQAGDVTMWRSKNSDTFKPMGPWIVTGLDPDEMITTVRVNNKETVKFPTNRMLFDVATFISEISQYIALLPGDVIWMGTDGVSPDLEIGDVVEIEISGIGTLRNRVVAEDSEFSANGAQR